MSLALNRLLDRYKHKVLSYVGDLELRDHLLRTDVSYVDFKLTAAQLNTLNATPITVLAAPGAGLITLPVGCLWKIDFASAAFENGSGTVSLKYTNASGVKAIADLPNATFESGADTFYYSVAASGVPVANAVIQACTDADVTSGDGTLYGRFYYRVIKHSEMF